MGLFDSLKDKLTGAKKDETQKAQASDQPQPRATPGATAKPAAPSQSQTPAAPVALPGVKNVVAVASGKGGVGKSTTSVGLAYALKNAGFRVGLLDADIYGPSLPHMLGVTEAPSARGNVVIPPEKDGIKVLSIGMFTEAKKPAILRGPMAAAVIKQFLTQADWGEIDYLVIDYPPGTGDIQLTISQTINVTGAVIVTTPQQISLIDVRKAIGMFATTKIPVMGVVETMSYFECVCDGKTERHHIFGKGGGEVLARENGVSLITQVPIDPQIAEYCDRGAAFDLMQANAAYADAFKEAATKVKARCEALAMASSAAKKTFALEWQNPDAPK